MRTSRWAIGALGAAVALGACSSGAKSGGASNVASNGSPAQAVAAALSKLGAQTNTEMTLSLPISQAQAEEIKGGSASPGPTPAEAKALTDSTLFLTFASGHGEAIDSTQAQTDPQDSVDLGWTSGGSTPGEIRYVGQNLYLRVDVKQALSAVGQNPAKATQFTNEVSSLNGEIPGIAAVAQGKWGEIAHAGLLSLGAALKQAAGTGSTNTATVQADVMRLRTDVLAALKADSTISSVGSSNGRNEYAATIQVAKLIDTVGPELSSTLGNLPGVGSKLGNSINHAKLGIAPGQTAVVDLYVEGGKLSEVDLDINQFKHEYSFAIPLRIQFSSPGAPTAPSGSTNLDVSKVPGLLSQLLGGLGGNSSNSA